MSKRGRKTIKRMIEFMTQFEISERRRKETTTIINLPCIRIKRKIES